MVPPEPINQIYLSFITNKKYISLSKVYPKKYIYIKKYIIQHKDIYNKCLYLIQTMGSRIFRRGTVRRIQKKT